MRDVLAFKRQLVERVEHATARQADAEARGALSVAERHKGEVDALKLALWLFVDWAEGLPDFTDVEDVHGVAFAEVAYADLAKLQEGDQGA